MADGAAVDEDSVLAAGVGERAHRTFLKKLGVAARHAGSVERDVALGAASDDRARAFEARQDGEPRKSWTQCTQATRGERGAAGSES